MQRNRMAEIGLYLIGAGVVVALLWWFLMRSYFAGLLRSGQISPSAFSLLMVSPTLALTALGFALYVKGRKAFNNHKPRIRSFVAFLGLAFMLTGGFFGVWYGAYAVYVSSGLPPPHDQPLGYSLAANSPYFALFALWILSGVLIFADAIDTSSSKGGSRRS